MTAKQRIQHGNKYPFDATDEWWNGDVLSPPPATDRAHRTARGVIAELQDRRGIGHGFDNIDEDIRVEIVNKLAEIIRAGMA